MWNCHNPYAERDATLKRMGFGSYRAYLKSRLWAEITVRVIVRARNHCERCSVMSAGRRLQVHHRAYDQATLRGESIDSLTAVCRKCHCKAERPTDYTRTRYERLQESSELLMTTVPDLRELVERWYRKHRCVLPIRRTYDERLALVQAFRSRATAIDQTPRCPLCRARIRPDRETKPAASYAFCANHAWSSIRAYLECLQLAA